MSSLAATAAAAIKESGHRPRSVLAAAHKRPNVPVDGLGGGGWHPIRLRHGKSLVALSAELGAGCSRFQALIEAFRDGADGRRPRTERDASRLDRFCVSNHSPVGLGGGMGVPIEILVGPPSGSEGRNQAAIRLLNGITRLRSRPSGRSGAEIARIGNGERTDGRVVGPKGGNLLDCAGNRAVVPTADQKEGGVESP